MAAAGHRRHVVCVAGVVTLLASRPTPLYYARRILLPCTPTRVARFRLLNLMFLDGRSALGRRRRLSGANDAHQEWNTFYDQP